MTTWSKRCLLLSVIFLITDLAPPVSAYLHSEGGLRIRRGRNIPVRISSLRIVNIVKNENGYCDIIEIERKFRWYHENKEKKLSSTMPTIPTRPSVSTLLTIPTVSRIGSHPKSPTAPTGPTQLDCRFTFQTGSDDA